MINVWNKVCESERFRIECLCTRVAEMTVDNVEDEKALLIANIQSLKTFSIQFGIHMDFITDYEKQYKLSVQSNGRSMELLC